jgi:hypothetical protein
MSWTVAYCVGAILFVVNLAICCGMFCTLIIEGVVILEILTCVIADVGVHVKRF